MVRQKRRDIQGLRAIAVGLVVLFHAGIPGIGGGFVGVDVFFVISGFLISTHLLEGLERNGGVGFASFYARRARRLLPAAFTVIAVTVGCAAIWVSPVQLRSVLKDAIATTFYVPNFLFARNATDYLADKTPSLFLHYWSLGVEEQFYLVWPLMLLILFKMLRLTWKTAAVLTLVVAASFVGCVWLTGYSQPEAFFMLPARVWEFGIGTLVALFLINPRRRISSRWAVPMSWIGLACIVVAGVMFSAATVFPGYAAALPVVGTALTIAAGPARFGAVAILGLAPMTWLGDISYSLYLVHWPALVLPSAAEGYIVPLPLWETAGIAVACVPVAWLLYRYVELPGQRNTWLASRPRRTMAAAGAAMAVVTLTTVGVAAVTAHARLDAGRAAPVAAVAPDPAGTGYVPNNLVPSLTGVANDEPVIYLNGCHQYNGSTNSTGCRVGDNPAAPLVELFGDSHAAQWFPALSVLANRGLIRLQSHTKSACPSAQPVNLEFPECDVWRRGVIRRLTADPPDLILLGNYGHYYTQYDGDAFDDWRSALTTVTASLPSKSHVAILADTPSTGVTPSICLGEFVDDATRCALPRSQALYPAVRSAEAEVAHGGSAGYLDFTDLFCNDRVCPSIIGNALVYRDGTHITTAYSAEFADTMMNGIRGLLA